MFQHSSQPAVIRTIAVFEGAKAVVFLAVGFGILSLLHGNAEAAAIDLIRHLHLNPAHRFIRPMIAAVSHVTDTEIMLVASFAILDAIIRAIEGIGLWYQREWAKWLSIVTALLYLPIEIYEMFHHLTWLKTLAFVSNVAIVIYLYTTLKSRSSTSEPKA